MNKKLILFAIVTLLLSCKNKKNETKRELDEVDFTHSCIEKEAQILLKDSAINSVSITVFNNGEEYIKHFGELDKRKGNIPTNETIYEIASVTKTFTGYLMAKAVLNQKISLNDDIRKYLNGNYPNLEYKGHPITVKDIITHTARLPYNIKQMEEIMKKNGEDNIRAKDIMFEIATAYKKATRETFLNELHEAEIDTIPGTKYSYSNNGANLAGHILETVYNKDFERLLEEHIFSKAKMNSSYTQHSSQKTVANGYNENGELMPFLTLENGYGAEGSIKSTTSDIINYMKFLLKKDENVKEALSEKFKLGERSIGYFWRIKKNEIGVKYYYHGGGAFGTRNMLYIIPELNIGIHLISNVAGASSSRALHNAGYNLIEKLTSKN